MTVRTALQINLHPLDAPHVLHTLPHQLAVWAGQVERIALVVDTLRSRNGRYRGAEYEEKRAQLFAQLEAEARRDPRVAIEEVDYGRAAREAVRARYFGSSGDYPDKAFDGGPFHAYFYGLMRADADYVAHMDSDMLFGGGSQSWLEEAIGWFRRAPDALFVGPLPGPPRVDGSLADRHRSFPGLPVQAPPARLAAEYPAYRFGSVSTRIFVLDERRFSARIGALDLVAPPFAKRLRARLFRQNPRALPAEETLTLAMQAHGLCRIDFLGRGPGLYSLHPPYRSASFYRDLPALIARIGAGDVPDAQRGDYDVNHSMIDWSEALRRQTRARRLVRAARALAAP